MREAEGVTTIELKVAEAGRPAADARPRRRAGPALLRLVTTLIASEVERVRAPERASEEAAPRASSAPCSSGRSAIATTWSRAARSSGPSSTRAERSSRRRARASAQPDRGRLAPAPARGRGARRAVDRARRDRGAARRRRRRGGRARARPRRRRRPARRRYDPARARVGPARLRVRDRPQPRAPATRSTCTAPATRRCWRQRRRGRPRALGARLRRDRHLPAAAAAHERPRRAQALLRRDGAALVAYDEQYETDLLGTLDDVPRVRRQRQRDRGAARSPTATRSATGSSACASSPASTSPRPTAARSCRSA